MQGRGRHLGWSLLAGVLVAAPLSLAAGQTPIVDAGQFVISRNGQRVGTESFTITQVTNGGGLQLRATATHRDADNETVDTLVTDGLGSPDYYGYVRTEGGAVAVRVGATRAGNRLTMTSRSRAGDASTKELLVTDGMMLLDPDVYSQFYFLFLPQQPGRSHPGAPPLLVAPLTGTKTPGTVAGGGPGDIQIAGTRVASTRYTFGDTQIWVSRTFQILQIEIPAQHLLVTREQPPR
jgi:hypothetical protein